MKPPCSEEITGEFISAKMYQKVIILEQENGNYVIYDLTQQATNCDIDISDNTANNLDCFFFGKVLIAS